MNNSNDSSDEMQEFSELHKKLMTEVLTTSAVIEREFNAILNTDELVMSYAEMAELNTLYSRWKNDVDYLKKSIQADATARKHLAYVNEAVDRLEGRIDELTKNIIKKAEQAEKRLNSSFCIPSKVITSVQHCNHCGKDIALLIFADNASNLAELKAYAQVMAEDIKRTNLPTYVLAAPNDPSFTESPSLLLKVHPAMEEPFFITPDEWKNLITKISNTHCKPPGAAPA
jgi:hypothetical protein